MEVFCPSPRENEREKLVGINLLNLGEEQLLLACGMHHLTIESYRSLELLCRTQAAISAMPATRIELERMALEYKRLADWLEDQAPEPGPAK